MPDRGEWLGRIDWSRPWSAPLLPFAAPLLEAGNWRDALNRAASERGLQNHAGRPLCFVPQEELPVGVAYETFIADSGRVPTRDNLHDFFNALIWLAFPATKVRLNALQAAEIAVAGAAASGGRGRLRDAATIFDENGVFLLSSDPARIEALRERRWTDFFFEAHEPFAGKCKVWIFGHALLEKLVTPYKAITAHAYPLVVEPQVLALPCAECRARIDALAARALDDHLATRHFAPLPVMGIPGWSGEQDEAFYADTTVFRLKPAR